MEKINIGRVLLGGLAAGFVMNISEFLLNAVVLAKDLEAAMHRLNLPPAGGAVIIIMVLLTFITGIVTVWLYAAIRPRFSPGPKSAIFAGLIVWFLIFVHGAVADSAMGLFPASISLIAVVWGLFEACIGALVGGWLYKET
ncbi:MAG: hypothetical protein WBV94_03550 [Blastocatellia bacterium]